ncbi:MAG TPA: hypothetical protein VNA25_07680, partial [Phycisphaerae bacterium]|nr:hypothetical protein [Phycisphaerae bacterium]
VRHKSPAKKRLTHFASGSVQQIVLLRSAFDGTRLEAGGTVGHQVISGPTQQQRVEALASIAGPVELQAWLQRVETIHGAGEADPMQRATVLRRRLPHQAAD